MNRSWLVGLAVLVLGACGHDDGTMMSDYAQDVGRHLDALRAEQTAHSSEVLSLSTLDGIRGAESTHWQRMGDHLDQMNLVMSDMMACGSDRGVRIDTAEFAGSMQKIRSECDGHRQAMQNALDVDSARGEETRHGDAFQAEMGVMRGRWNMMMVQSRGYSCSHCRYCGM
jgi:hypothetical protein